MSIPLFQPVPIGTETFSFVNLTHPRVEKEIIADMAAGVAVYYDQRCRSGQVSHLAFFIERA